MRSGWEKDDRWAFFDMGRPGSSHIHEDKLNLEFYAFGTTFVLDPGISSYQADPVVRFFRTSASHNTVEVDGLHQWQLWNGDYRKYGSSSRGENLWVSGELLDVAQGCFEGPYGDLSDRNTLLRGVTHTRTLVFVKPHYWLVLDAVSGKGFHEVAALWHFAPMHVRADVRTATVRTQRLTNPNIELICRGDWEKGRFCLMTASEKPVQGFIALDREVKPAPCAVVARRKRLPLFGVTAAVAFRGGSQSGFRVSTRCLSSGKTAGTYVSVQKPDGMRDAFIWRHTGNGALCADEMVCRGRLGYVRSDGNGRPVCAALLDGSFLRCHTLLLTGVSGGLVESSPAGEANSSGGI